MQQDSQETEVRETTRVNGDSTVQQQTVARRETTSASVMIRRLVWFIAGLISIIIALRFVFLLLGANRDAGFTDFIYSLSAPFVAPFVGIFGEPTYGTSVFEVSSLLAIVIYALIAWAITKLFAINQPRSDV